MVKRQRKETVHQLVLVTAGEVTSRCGQTWKKPKMGLGSADGFSHNCMACDEATEKLLATLVAPH